MTLHKILSYQTCFRDKNMSVYFLQYIHNVVALCLAKLARIIVITVAFLHCYKLDSDLLYISYANCMLKYSANI